MSNNSKFSFYFDFKGGLIVKTVLITGGSGYIGTVLVTELLKKGYKVKLLDLMIYDNQVDVNNKNLTIYKMDIRENSIDKVLRGVDIVIHLASISNDPGYGISDETGYEINYEATKKLFEKCKEYNVKRFIYPSSCSVYGNINEDNIVESSKIMPLTNYAKCKFLCEDYILNNSTNEMTTVILRPATVYGFSPRQRFDLLINKMVCEAFVEGKITVNNSECIRPNIYIKELVNIYLEIIESPSKLVHNQIFNVAQNNRKVLDLAYEVKSLFEKNVEVIKKGSKGDARSYSINSNKIKSIVKVENLNFTTGVEELVEKLNDSYFVDPINNEFYYNALRQPQYFKNVFS